MICRSYGALHFAAPSLTATIEELAQQYAVGVLTRGVGRVQRAKLAKLGLTDLLDDIAISHELEANKPDGSLFKAAERRLPADRYVYLSTHESDVRHARRAGWEAELVESVEREELESALEGGRVGLAGTIQRRISSKINTMQIVCRPAFLRLSVAGNGQVVGDRVCVADGINIAKEPRREGRQG